MTNIILFILLNLIDGLTTIAGLKFYLLEGNTLLRSLFEYNPFLGLAVKIALCLITALLLKLFNKLHLLKIINIAFALIVIWNLCCIAIF